MNITTLKKHLPVLSLIIYLLFVFYITLLSRDSSLMRFCKMQLFWSYISWLKGNNTLGKEILLNILLFVPIGWFLFDSFPFRAKYKRGIFTVGIGLIISGIIEAVQYFKGLGLCEIDDILNNFIGACLGVILQMLFLYFEGNKRLQQWKVVLSVLFLLVGLVGCKVAHSFSQNPNYRLIAQYDFDITGLIFDERTLSLHGYCRVYDRDTPDYQIILKGEQTGRLYETITRVDKDIFNSLVKVIPKEKVGVKVKFKGYSPMDAFVYLNNGQIEYVQGKIPQPDIQGTDLAFIVEKGVLKLYEPSKDFYVYQLNNLLYWLIGVPVDKQVGVVFHLFTNEPDKLPEHRKKYEFDNRSFRIGGNNEITGTMRCGTYRVFKREIPSEYNIIAASTGFFKNKQIQWIRYFRIKK